MKKAEIKTLFMLAISRIVLAISLFIVLFFLIVLAIVIIQIIFQDPNQSMLDDINWSVWT